MERREFLKRGLAAGAAVVLGGCAARSRSATGVLMGGRPGLPTPEGQQPLLAVAKGGRPGDLTRRAMQALGGMRVFVKQGQTVVIKPNAAWQRTAEQAANTNPEVVGTLVRLCREAGASQVTVLEHTIDEPARLVFEVSGLEQAVKEAGGELVSANEEGLYVPVAVKGHVLKQEQVARQIMEADVFINVPIAKQHDSTGLTLGMKNLMGVIWNRGAWHAASGGLHRCIAEFANAVRPNLVVMDAWRIMLTRGPKGPGQTKDTETVLACTDQVAIDAYTTRLFGKEPADVQFITIAADLGVGQEDMSKVRIVDA